MKGFTLIGDPEGGPWKVRDGGLSESDHVLLNPVITAKGLLRWEIIRNGISNSLTYTSREAAIEALQQDLNRP